MPYGIAKEDGGDSPENVKWMEGCGKKVKAKNPSYPKGRCIAICKTTLHKTKMLDKEAKKS